jgi:hypothetical protein
MVFQRRAAERKSRCRAASRCCARVNRHHQDAHNSDVEAVLKHASSIDRFLTANTLDASAQPIGRTCGGIWMSWRACMVSSGTEAAPSICGGESTTSRSGQLLTRMKKNDHVIRTPIEHQRVIVRAVAVGGESQSADRQKTLPPVRGTAGAPRRDPAGRRPAALGAVV